MLLEREYELDALADAIAVAHDGAGGILLLEGPAGIGKTALIHRAGAMSRDAGMRVLTARGGELERDFGFGVVGQLFEPAIRGTTASHLLTGPAAHAAPILRPSLGGAANDEPRGERTLPVLHGLFWLVVDVSEEQPLTLLIDDAHWADTASLRFLSYLGHRIEGLPVLVVLAARSGADAERVAAAVPTADAREIRLLSAAATSALVCSVAPATDQDVCRACHDASGGNPFFVLELARALRDDGLAAGHDSARRLLDWSPGRVTRSVNARLRALSTAAQALADATAVLGQGTQLQHAATLGAIDVAEANDAADELLAAGILAPRRPLEFVHPIVRAAVYDELPPGVRSKAHVRAAALLAQAGASAERIAIHVMHSESAGDPNACRRLVEGAREASERGAPDAAVVYLRRALQEPPTPEDKNQTLIELAIAEGLTFEVDLATAHLREAFEGARTRDERLQIALLIATLAGHSAGADEAILLLSRAREQFGDQPSVLASIDAQIANTARFELSARRDTLPITRRLRALAGLTLPDDATVLAAVAAELAMAGDSCERAAETALRGLDAIHEDARLIGGVVYLILVRVLIISDRLEQAGAALESWLDRSRRTGSALDYAFASLFRADVMYRRGDVFESEADSGAVYQFGLEHAWPMGAPVIAYHRLTSLIERGELAEAESELATMGLTGPAADQPGLYTSNLLLFARGRLRGAGGNPTAALEDLFECGRRQELWEEPNPAVIPWRSEAALACHALGRVDEAQSLAGEEVELANRFGAPRALGIALYAAARVADGADRLDLAREAANVLSRSQARLEYARALAELGDMAGPGRDDTERRATLREALELANTCGASALEGRILASLRAAGARPRRARLTGPQALTPSERRVARMAASGLSNREIAESLFVTVRTVEFHLRRAYRKLRIEGRSELTTDLLDDTSARSSRPRHASPQ
jgi:DNA-binding CsgD family transcriptional regulator